MITFNEYQKKNTKPLDEISEKVDQILTSTENKTEISSIIEESLEASPVEKILKENFYTKEEPLVQENVPHAGYVLYRDKPENFLCDMELSGVTTGNSKARIILETEELTYMFEGTVDSRGKCKIPLKKMNFLDENTTGKIKLEVIADDTVFTPWEDSFVAVNSKKVSVKVVESEVVAPKIGIKVTNIRK